MEYTLISYCCGTYPSIGGVARYDTQLKIIFKDRIFFEGSRQKKEMLEKIEKVKNPIIITDNHLACDIPNKYPVLLVHHGCGRTHAEREPLWDKYWKELCCNGQDKMLKYRNKENTWIISCSEFCTEEFGRHYEEYKLFRKMKILHSSEMDEREYKSKFNEIPKILGNWQTENKGLKIIERLKQEGEYNFIKLDVMPKKGETIENFNRRKQEIYKDCDIFLQLSLCEGNSYATLDALLCGLLVVGSNVGLLYKDVPEDCYIKIEWERNGDIEYVKEKIRYGWENKEEITKKAREWYMNNCRFREWSDKMKKVVEDFAEFNYKNKNT
jgi:hypothetical protein